MTHHIIIRGQRDGGKTTTCAVLYKELKKVAEYSKILTMSWKPIETLRLTPEGNYSDFIAVFIVKGKLIILISAGDIAGDLEDILNKLSDQGFLSSVFEGRKKIDLVICCARSRNVKGSTIRMLHERITDPNARTEFWVPEKTLSKSDAEEDKKILAKKIIKYFENFN